MPLTYFPNHARTKTEARYQRQRMRTQASLRRKSDQYKGIRIAERLYVRGTIQGYRCGPKNPHPSAVIVHLDDVENREEAEWYNGKYAAYVYTTFNKNTGIKDTKTIWGVVDKPHGNSGAVRVRFTPPPPPTSFGKPVRVMLYPSSI